MTVAEPKRGQGRSGCIGLFRQPLDQRLQRRDGGSVRLAVRPLGPEVALKGLDHGARAPVVD